MCDDIVGYIDLPCKFSLGNQVKIIKTGEVCTVTALTVGVDGGEYGLKGKDETFKENELELVRKKIR